MPFWPKSSPLTVTLPNSPSFSSLMPAAKKRELVAAPPCPLPNVSPQRPLVSLSWNPPLRIRGWPWASVSWPRNCAGLQVERVDLAVAEVADEQGVAELPEVVRGDGDPVRRVEQPLRGEPRDELAAQGELVDEAVAHARDVVVPGVVLLGVGDEQRAVDVLEAERGEPGRDVRVGERAAGEGGRAGSSCRRRRRCRCGSRSRRGNSPR